MIFLQMVCHLFQSLFVPLALLLFLPLTVSWPPPFRHLCRRQWSLGLSLWLNLSLSFRRFSVTLASYALELVVSLCQALLAHSPFLSLSLSHFSVYSHLTHSPSLPLHGTLSVLLSLSAVANPVTSPASNRTWN